MMYRFVKTMAYISHFSIIKDKIVFVERGKFYVDTKEFNILPVLYKSDITNNNLWIKDNNWENYSLNLLENSLEKLAFNLGLNGTITDLIIIFKNNILSCYSTIERKIVSNFPLVESVKDYLSFHDSVFCQVENYIKSLSLLTGEYEWEVDLGEYCTFVQDNETRQGNINSIIGVYQEQLWLMCSNRRLLGLCIHTGKTLSNVWLGDLSLEIQNLVVLSPPIIDEANNQFIFCTYQYYFTINADTLKLSIFHKIPFEGRADNIQTQTIYNNMVYFTGQHYLPNDRYESQVGVYDPVNNAILWTYGINEIINQVPQVTENKLYILDTGGTLHIFEKE